MLIGISFSEIFLIIVICWSSQVFAHNVKLSCRAEMDRTFR
jgi:hypothetical protein